jgi:hypothetical protein
MLFDERTRDFSPARGRAETSARCRLLFLEIRGRALVCRRIDFVNTRHMQTEALSMSACAVSETGIFDFARGYLADHDGRSDHVGRAFLTFWAS